MDNELICNKCLLENFIKNKAETGTLDILAYSCY